MAMLKTFFIVFLLYISASAQAVTFDCNVKLSEIEQAICDNDSIGLLDDELGFYYKKVVDLNGLKSIIDSQRLWLRERSGCQKSYGVDLDCLSSKYISRIEYLKSLLVGSNSGSQNFGAYDSVIRDNSEGKLSINSYFKLFVALSLFVLIFLVFYYKSKLNKEVNKTQSLNDSESNNLKSFKPSTNISKQGCKSYEVIIESPMVARHLLSIVEDDVFLELKALQEDDLESLGYYIDSELELWDQGDDLTLANICCVIKSKKTNLSIRDVSSGEIIDKFSIEDLEKFKLLDSNSICFDDECDISEKKNYIFSIAYSQGFGKVSEFECDLYDRKKLSFQAIKIDDGSTWVHNLFYSDERIGFDFDLDEDDTLCNWDPSDAQVSLYKSKLILEIK